MSKFEAVGVVELEVVCGGAVPNVSTLTNGPQAFGAKVGAAMASGKFDFNRMLDNGNRYGNAGMILGSGGGAVAGGLVGGPPGAGLGAALGGAGGGVVGFLGGAAYDANQQANEINSRR